MRVAHEISGGFEFIELPKAYKNYPAFYKMTEDKWNEEGYYRIEKEPLGADQKQGQFSEGSLVNNVWVIPAIDMTQAEIDQRAENQLNSDESANATNNREFDGQDYLRKKFAEIERQAREAGTQTAKDRARNIRLKLWDYLAPLRAGLWDVTQTKLDELQQQVVSGAVTLPAYLQTFMQDIKTDIDTYVTNNY